MFVGVPLGLFVLITLVVMTLVTSRVPDGLAKLAEGSTSAPDEEHPADPETPVADAEQAATEGDSGEPLPSSDA